MKIKFYLILLILPALTFAQFRPTEFDLNSKSKMQKSASGKTPLSNSINDVLVVGDTIWTATSKGLSVSYDNGSSWRNYYGDDVFGYESAVALEYWRGVIFVSTAHHEESYDGSSVITGSGMKISTDGGESWISVPQSMDAPGDSTIVYGINTLRALPITVPQQNVTYDIAVLNDTIYATSWSAGLRRNTLTALLQNSDAKWERVVLPPDYLDSISPDDTLNFSLQPVAGAFGPEHYLNHVAFSVVVTDSGHIYVGTANGINKSTDGVSWRKFNFQNQIEGISGNFITSLGYDKSTGAIWATTWKAVDPNEFDAVSATFDGGESWRRFLNGEKGHGFGFIPLGNDGNVLVATDNGIYRTEDNGVNWFLPGDIRDERGYGFDRFVKFYSCDAKANDSGDKTIWIGTSEGLAEYIESAPAPIWSGDWTIFFASQELENADETYAFPNPFNPTLQEVKIKYYIQEDNTPVTIRIYNFDMQIVRTLLQNATRDKGEQLENWDGCNDGGIYAPNGVYFYVIERGDADKIFGKIMVLK